MARVVPNRAGMDELETDLALGLFAVALVAETEAKREAPVRGGYRSFRPGTKPIGGTLRRSIHAVAFDSRGRQVGVDNPSGDALPGDYVPVSGKPTAFVGTNSGYGAFVELGTVKMQARPFLAPAFDVALARAPQTIERALARIRGKRAP